MGTRAELKLLACQNSEQMWSAVSGDDLLPLSAEQANSFNTGALVLVDLTSNKQIQRFQEAGRQLVSILQNFSRLQERVRVQEDEIEQWKASLTFQSQELQRRELEMEAREEQIQNMDGDLAQLDKQREELAETRAEIDRLQAELDENRKNLEGAWDNLKGEQERLEQLKTEGQADGVGLSMEQTNVLNNWLDQFGTMIAPMDSLPDNLQSLAQAIATQQSMVQRYQKQFDQASTSAQSLQDLLKSQTKSLADRHHELQELLRSLEANKLELAQHQHHLASAQALHQKLSESIELQTSWQQQVCETAGLNNSVLLTDKVDIQALEQLSVEELQQVIADLQRDLAKMVNFVNDQEEELRYQQEAIDEIKVKIQQAGEYDRLHLETELADEQDRYRLLDETLIGQRRSLRDREAVLEAHMGVLKCAQGQATDGDAGAWKVLLDQLVNQRQKLLQEQQELETKLQQLPSLIDQLESKISDQTLSQLTLQEDVSQLEQELKNRQLEVAVQEKVAQDLQDLVQQMATQLEQMQDSLNHVMQIVSQTQTNREQRQELLASVRQSLNGALN